MARIVGVFGLVMALCLPAVAGAQMDLSDDNRLLTIAGQVAADQKAAAAYGQAGVSIGFVGGSPDKLVWVGGVKAQSWDGDDFAGRDMLTRVQGFTPTMTASGKSALLTKIQQASVGSRIKIEGIFDVASRSYLVGMVQVTPGASK